MFDLMMRSKKGFGPLMGLAVAALILLVFFPALILNIALFKFLTNPVLHWVLIIGLILFILHKLGLLRRLIGMVR